MVILSYSLSSIHLEMFCQRSGFLKEFPVKGRVEANLPFNADFIYFQIRDFQEGGVGLVVFPFLVFFRFFENFSMLP